MFAVIFGAAVGILGIESQGLEDSGFYFSIVFMICASWMIIRTFMEFGIAKGRFKTVTPIVFLLVWATVIYFNFF